MINFVKEININNLHHGYLIIGDREENKKSIFDFLESELGVKTLANPDFSFFDFNTLTIEEARELSLMQARKGFGQDSKKENETIRKFFVISTNIITDEAQNALLKIFEEPTAGSHFFIIASQNTFLPTFLSRLNVINSKQISSNTHQPEILKKNLVDRLALVAKIASEISDEKKVKQDAIDFVSQLEDEFMKSSGVEKYTRELKACESARTALFSRGAMIKMVLENLILQI